MPRPAPSPTPPRRASGGFTLVELLAVIAIVGVLATLLIVAATRARESARAARCSENLRQIAQALLLSAADNRGALPPGWTWDQKIAPYLGVTVLSPVSATPPAPWLVCPADNREIARPRSYAASAQSASHPGIGVFSRSTTLPSLRLAQIIYPNRTILVTEFYTGSWAASTQFSTAYPAVDGWLAPAAAPLRDGAPYHGSGQNYAFCDGHIERLPPQAVTGQTGGFTDGGRWRAYVP